MNVCERRISLSIEAITSKNFNIQSNNVSPNINTMRTPVFSNESNRLNTPYVNTDSDKDKRQYQEEYFGNILKSYIDSLNVSIDNSPINEDEISCEIDRMLIARFDYLIWRLEKIDSDYYLISKKQGTINEDSFFNKLLAEILKPLQLNYDNVPINFRLVLKGDRDGIDKSRVISFLKQGKEILNRMERVNYTVLIDFLIEFTTNLFKLKS